MELNLIDHLLSLFLLVLMPIWGIWDFQGLEEKIQSGQRGLPHLFDKERWVGLGGLRRRATCLRQRGDPF